MVRGVGSGTEREIRRILYGSGYNSGREHLGENIFMLVSHVVLALRVVVVCVCFWLVPPWLRSGHLYLILLVRFTHD
jgi:hypothetical protein